MRCLALLTLGCAVAAFASVDASSIPVRLELSTAMVGGTLLLPRATQPYPCAVIIGGTLSQLRDGELVSRTGVPRRTALKRLAETLASAGYGSFRYDQIGQGESRAKTGYRDLYAGDSDVLADLYRYLRGRTECSKVMAVGESAGAYIASLAAKAGAQADAYLFLGGFCGKAEEIFEYNFGRLFNYVNINPSHAAWARANALNPDLAFGLRWREMFAAAHAGKPAFEVVSGNYRQSVDLARRREEIDNPPDEMFAHIKAPALALAGTRDLNVAPHHAACAVAVMQRAGNLRTQSILIDGADHNFQIAPNDLDLAFRERYTFASFNRPYHPNLDHEVLEWLQATLPVTRANHPGGHSHSSASPNSTAWSSAFNKALAQPEVEPRTAVSPERFHLAPGLTVIDDIIKARGEAGVETLEGFIGPLLRTPDMRAHFIDMPAGLYLDEHPHAKGSIIYTVRGQWALKSLGRWHHMKPGSLYWFGDNIPTGYQVPFREDAYILIFKATPGDEDAQFSAYLQNLAGNLKKDQAAGTVFRLSDLPDADPARRFARSVNPHFEQDFATPGK